MLRKWPVAAAALVVLAVSTWAAVHRYGRATGFSQLFDPPVLNSSSTGPPARPVAISRPSVIPESGADARALWLASAGSTAINGSQVRALSAHFQGCVLYSPDRNHATSTALSCCLLFPRAVAERLSSTPLRLAAPPPYTVGILCFEITGLSAPSIHR